MYGSQKELGSAEPRPFVRGMADTLAPSHLRALILQQTSALYKSCTYLLTYLLILETRPSQRGLTCRIWSLCTSLTVSETKGDIGRETQICLHQPVFNASVEGNILRIL